MRREPNAACLSTAATDNSSNTHTLDVSTPSAADDSVEDTRDAQAAAKALEAHLQKAFQVYLSDALTVVEKAPLFVKRLVVLTRDSQPPDGSKKAIEELAFGKKVAAFLNDSNTNVLEAVLESLELDSKRTQNLLPKLSLEAKDVQGLHFVIRKFHRLGISRSKIGDMLEKQQDIVTYTEEHIEAGIKTLNGLGIHDDEVLSLLVKFPLILTPLFIGNVECILDEINAFSSKQQIVRSSVCKIPSKLISYKEGSAIGIVKYIRSLGLPPEKVNTLLHKRPALVITSVDKAKAVVDYLTDVGLSRAQIRKVLFKNSNVLLCDVEKNLKAKYDFFKSLGFTDAEMTKMISSFPNLFTLSLKNKVKPVLDELRGLGLTDSGIKKVILYRPSLFSCKLGGEVSTVINDLKMMNCPENRKITAFMKVFVRGSEHFKKTEACLTSFGLSSSEAKEILEKQPKIFGFDEKALTKRVEILTKTLGLPVQSLLTAPDFLSVALKRCILRRLCLLSHLKSKGLLESSVTLQDLVSQRTGKFYYLYIRPHCNDASVAELWKSRECFLAEDDHIDFIEASATESSVEVKEPA